MTARSLLQAFVGLVVIGTSPLQVAAEQPPSDPQTAEVAEETPSETDPAATSPSSQAEAVESEPDDATTESFFADKPDSLFDDDDVFEQSRGYPDPLEEPNRVVFSFNRGLDTYLMGPIASFFGYVTPTPLKRGLRNLFANLNAPVVVVNDMLQLEWMDAVVCTSAFVVNTTVGIVGFFEPAKHIGLPRHESDFGQTLALARVPSGPYLILPIAGPSTARGTVGSLVDFFMRPNTWLFPLSNFYYYGGQGVVELEEHQDELKELERSSIDFYSVLHSAYYQTRDDAIWGRRQDRRPPELD